MFEGQYFEIFWWLPRVLKDYYLLCLYGSHRHQTDNLKTISIRPEPLFYIQDILASKLSFRLTFTREEK